MPIKKVMLASAKVHLLRLLVLREEISETPVGLQWLKPQTTMIVLDCRILEDSEPPARRAWRAKERQQSLRLGRPIEAISECRASAMVGPEGCLAAATGQVVRATVTPTE